jgi:hypothetical protein
MEIQADYTREKAEVEAVLASGILNRAPNLVQILTYICAKSFEGSAGAIKEYNIAVEALGRPADFDQRRDSIVRVEAHRLRKRLREYYENEGAEHRIQINIPPGQYAPSFVLKEAAMLRPAASTEPEPEARLVPAEALVPLVESIPAARSNRWPIASIVIAASLAVAGTVAFSLAGRVTSSEHNELPVPAQGNEIRILAGDVSNPYIDAFSRNWSADRFFTGGTVAQSSSPHSISGTRDPHLYQSRREGTFNYDIPLTQGIYELHLYFAETLYGENNIAGGGETSRIFQVSANGRPLLPEFDVIGDVGPSAADIKVFKDISPAKDGRLHLKFEAGTNPAFLNAIEVIPGMPGKMRPVRIVARDRGFTDKSGRYWVSDRYVRGGQLVARTEPVTGGEDPDLFHGERFGNITYTIPVAQHGPYGVTLYFVESWFGPGRPGGGGERSRIFDIQCNGVSLKRNFDIFKEAGGSNRALTLKFHDLEPNPQGKLVVSLVPSRNYAAINALEVQDESK